jgi:hypothetical protein
MKRPAFLERHPYFALAGAGSCLFGLALGLVDPKAALSGWLVGFFFWSSVPIGGLFLLMMMRLMPGAWTDTLQPPANAALPLVILAAVALLPLLVGAGTLYPWATGSMTDGFKSGYLATRFFCLRSIFFFLCLGVWSFLLFRRTARTSTISVVGLIVFTILDTLMAYDWLMSLAPEFHSSGFGLYAMSIQIVIALAFLILASVLLPGGAFTNRYRGAIFLTALLLWAYFSFMQYFITWSGDLPQGVRWYQQRGGGVWSAAEWTIAMLHLLPMLLLIFPPIRLDRRWLGGLALAVLLGKALETSWLVLPTLPSHRAIGSVSAAAAMFGLGLLSVAIFLSASRTADATSGARAR